MSSGPTNPIVFFGTEDFSLNALRALVEAGYTVAFVVTKPDSPQGRGHKLTPPAVKTYAAEHGIAVLQPRNLKEIIDPIKDLSNPAGVLVSYGKIIPQSIIDLFTPGIINVHPSLLPKYRGPSPIEAAILNGDEKTGVSIMLLTADMDAGPVYYQKTYELQNDETGPELLDTLGGIGILELIKVLPDILNGSLQPTPQNHEEATYCHIIKKSDGIIDWNNSSVQIERQVRAYKSWPQSRTTLGNSEFIITEAAAIWPIENPAPGKIEVVYNEDVKTLFVGTADGSLEITAIKPLGKKEMPIQAFLAGYRSQLTP